TQGQVLTRTTSFTLYRAWQLFLGDLIEIGAFAENRRKQVPHFFDSPDGVGDVVGRHLQTFFHFVPVQRHGYRCARLGSERIGRSKCRLRTVLQEVEVDLSFPL